MESDLEVTRDGNKLIVRSEYTGKNFGALFVILGFLIVIFLGSKTSPAGFIPGGFIGLLVGVVFAAAGAFAMLPRVVTTVFDLRSRHVLRTTTFFRLFSRKRVYAFTDVTSIGTQQNTEDNVYRAVVRLKNWGIASLSASPQPDDERANDLKSIDTIAAATGFQRSDIQDWLQADLNYGLPDLLKLRPVSFTCIAQPGQGTQLGFLAQDVQPIFPEIVNVGDDPNHTLGLTLKSFQLS